MDDKWQRDSEVERAYLARPPARALRTSSRRPLASRLVNLKSRLVAAANEAYGNPFSEERKDPRMLRVKAAVYREVKSILQTSERRDIESLVLDDLASHPAVEFSHNEFLWAFYAILGSKDANFGMSYNLVNNYSWQLLHAYRHRIEPELLIGFLHQTAASSRQKQRLINKPGTTFFEPWFQAYEQRLGMTPS